jgi:uncharacterized repeat protein (TIGR03803 family)
MTPARSSCCLEAVFSLVPWLRTVLLLGLAMSITPTTLHAQTYTDLHNFSCISDGCDGAWPGIPAQARDGNLYGTLPAGGSSSNGTIYKITPSGSFNAIHNFSGSDGYGPYSGLTLGTDGDLYGVTYNDGANGYGTIFKITTAGALTTLHNFTAAEEGGAYGAPVQGKNGTFYGVTYYGKAYSITSAGTFKLLPNPTPGSSQAPLILASDGNLYGTTITGGIGYGTVFRMSSTGAIKVIYSFDYTHGYYPYGPVVQGSDGFLYGTASGGGSTAHAAGVVFKLSTGGAVTVLHEFDSTSTTDGYQPIASLVSATDGNFYGATSAGVSGGSAPYGTLFKITKTGMYTMLHAFDSTHGQAPETTPIQHTNGIVYGETYQGGSGSGSGGVFYSLNASISPFISLVGFPAGTAGQTVQILGNGLTGTTSVKFGSGSASFTVVSNTYMTAVVPTSGTSGTVTVATPGGTLKSKQLFKVTPVISSFTPSSGPVGTQVTITGTGLTGATKVTFGGVSAIFTVNSGTQVTATVPSGGVTGKIKITTAGGSATSPGAFTVT